MSNRRLFFPHPSIINLKPLQTKSLLQAEEDLPAVSREGPFSCMREVDNPQPLGAGVFHGVSRAARILRLIGHADA